jgi:hypothetical protein
MMCLSLILIVGIPVQGKKDEHQWFDGKILDENRARYFAGMLNDSSSQTTESGSLNANANSTSFGDATNTQINGSYSGTRTTSTSGISRPIYRVYDNLMIEGSETVYVTSERLRWRWSKGAHVAVNGPVKYYPDGRKLHILDNDGKEHTVAIVKEIRKPSPQQNPATASPMLTKTTFPVEQIPILIDSAPLGADIEIDGSFVGNTPSTVTVAPGSHDITVKKKGFADWTKKMNVTGGSIHLNAELEASPANP